MLTDHSKLAIVFDFGGVLVDWNVNYIYQNCFSNDHEITAFLKEIDFHKWNEELQRGTVSYLERVTEVGKRFPHYKDLVERFHYHWVEAVGETIYGTEEILIELHEKGYPTYGLSNWPVEKFLPVRDQLKFLNWMNDYIISGAVHQIKPEKDFFLTFLRRIKRVPSECIFIDDVQHNIQVAAEIGFITILFTTPEKLRIDLRQRGIAC